jgi:DNA-binding HxlR family transcriptional regulator
MAKRFLHHLGGLQPKVALHRLSAAEDGRLVYRIKHPAELVRREYSLEVATKS